LTFNLITSKIEAMEKREGFTLVELLIVVAIIAIVTGIAVPNVMSARIRARISGAKSEMGSIAILLEDYKMDNSGSYPLQPQPGLGTAHEIATASVAIDATTVAGLGKLIYPTSSDSTPVYLSIIPGDPFNEKGKEDWNGSTGAHNHHYSYFTSGDTCWALVSWGPDKDSDISNYTEAKAAVLNGTNMYDQSKGLTSDGDIAIIGP